jgi:hypothetical protein
MEMPPYSLRLEPPRVLDEPVLGFDSTTSVRPPIEA